MKIKNVAENINSLIGAKNKNQILAEKTNFQDVLRKACLNIRESSPTSPFLSPPLINSCEQIKTNRSLMKSWGIKTVEHTLDLLEKYKDDLLNPHVSAKELKQEMIILLNKTEEIGQIFKSERVDKDLREIVQEIRRLSQAEIEMINRGDYD